MALGLLAGAVALAACSAGEPPSEAPSGEVTAVAELDAGTDTSSASVAVFAGRVRCAEGSCHVGTATAAAHVALLGAEGHAKLGCTSCHHGEGAAKRKEIAHAPAGLKELLPRHLTGSACAHCHVPGSVPGTELVAAGAQVYLDLGCSFCHPGQPAPVGLAPFGPTLVGISARGTKFLAKILRDPGSVNKGTVMPSFAGVLDHDAEKDRALMAYLMSLRGVPTRKVVRDPRVRCATCHAATPVKAEPYAEHRCVVLRAEKARFACQGCHAGGVPESTKECLYVSQRRRECGVCHGGGPVRAP